MPSPELTTALGLAPGPGSSGSVLAVGGLPPHAGLLLGGALALTALAAVITGLVSGRDTSARRQERVRELSGAWASPRDVPDLLLRGADPARIVLGALAGKTIANPPRRSLMVLAPTGAGKTPRVVVPAVLRHHGPALVASVKSDVLLLTQAARARSGPVWVFDPTGATGLPAARWSPLAAVRSYGDAMKAAAWLADSSKVDGRGVEDQRFWDALGRKLLAPLLFPAAGTGRHIADVVRWVDYRAEDEVQDLLDTLGDPDAIAAWAANRARPDKTKGSVYGTAEVVLESFGHPAVRDALATAAGDPTAQAHARDLGYTTVVLDTSHRQTAAIALYQAYGYLETGRGELAGLPALFLRNTLAPATIESALGEAVNDRPGTAIAG